MLRGTYLWVSAAALACSDSTSTLILPPEILDGSMQSAIVLLQSNQTLDAEVLEAELVPLPPTLPLRFALEGEDDMRFRLLAYEGSPSELGLEVGPLERAPPGSGLPLPDPALAYVSSTLEIDLLEWTRMPAINMATVPWRQPGEVAGPECQGVHTEAWRVAGLELVQPRAVLPLDANRAIVAGQWGLEVGDGAKETLLVQVSDLDTSATFESLAPPLPMQTYRDVLLVGDHTILASSNRGWLTRLDLETREVTSEQVLPPNARWELSRGDDGTVVVFDAQDESPDYRRKPPRLVVPETLAVSQLPAPEAMRMVAVVRRDLMIAVGDRTIYRLEGDVWIAEHSTDQPITELARDEERFIVIVGRSYVLERGLDGVWVQVPSELSAFDLATGAFLPSGRFVAGGAAGFLLHLHEGRWCSIPRALSRSIRAIGAVDGTTGLAITYSETVGELVGITRFTFPP